MKNYFKNGQIVLTDKRYTPIRYRTGYHEMHFDIFQDGTSPAYRDVDGKLWVIAGHERVGHIAMMCGTCLDDLQEVYRCKLNFALGNSSVAFNGVPYPEGVRSRGSVWPLGFYICPKTHRFFAFIHNETGWAMQGSGYDALGPCKKPRFDSDFRHVGLMHSDDEGKNWTFDRWILSCEYPCFTEEYNPNGEDDLALGQKGPLIRLGCGDISSYIDPNDDYIYLFYNIITVNIETGKWVSCDQYVARTEKRYDGIMGEFKKYYNGSFCEPGNFGKETPIIEGTWHGRVVYHKTLDKYIISYTRFDTEKAGQGGVFGGIIEVRTSNDMLNWSEPVQVEYEGKELGTHYAGIYPDDKINPTCVIDGDVFSILATDNGTSMRYTTTIKK